VGCGFGRQRVPLGQARQQVVLELAGGQCRRVEVALLAHTAERDQRIGLGAGLHAVGGHREADLAHERDDRAHDRAVVGVRGDGVDRQPVDAHLVERQPAQQAQRRHAAGEVVEAHPATASTERGQVRGRRRQVAVHALSRTSIVTNDGSTPCSISSMGSSRQVRSVASGAMLMRNRNPSGKPSIARRRMCGRALAITFSVTRSSSPADAATP
jgi:hypothetical protein